jgi:formate hydrogenlyase subunit 3/multisubunit Na+/H+ antiporter MnhD subunit
MRSREVGAATERTGGDDRRYRGGWPLLWLFTAGVAWGAPFTLIGLTNVDFPGWAAHPELAARLAQWGPLLMLLVPILAVVGITVVSRLTPQPVLVHSDAVFTLLALSTGPLLLGLLAAFASPDFFLLFVALEATLAALVGLVVTVVTLARRHLWLGLLWSCLWLLTGVVIWIGEQPSPQSDDDLRGILAVALALVLLVTALVTTLVVAALEALRQRRSRRSLRAEA